MTSPTARDTLLARFRDETAGPPNGTEIAMRCTAHGRFIMWTSPPAPAVRIACPPACAAAERPDPLADDTRALLAEAAATTADTDLSRRLWEHLARLDAR